MNPFSELCLNTFIVFFGYWLVIAIATKTSRAVRKSTSRSSALSNDVQVNIKTPSYVKKTSMTKTNNTSCIKSFSSTEKELQLTSENYEGSSQNKIKKNESSITSDLNENNLAMIEYSSQLQSSDVCTDALEMLTEVNGESVAPYLKTSYKHDLSFGNENNKNKQASSGEQFNGNDVEEIETFKQETSEHELFKNLSLQMKTEKKESEFGLADFENEKKNEMVPNLETLFQKIDELFLSDQIAFEKLMSKYRSEEFSYEMDGKCERIAWLEKEMKRMEEEIGIMEIEISEYKLENEEKQLMIEEERDKNAKLSKELIEIQETNMQHHFNIQNKENIIQIEEQNLLNSTPNEPQLLKTNSLHESDILQENDTHFKIQNEQLKNEIEFAQNQIRMLERSEKDSKKLIENLRTELSKVNQSTLNSDVMELRSKISKIQPLANEYANIHHKLDDIRAKMIRMQQKENIFMQENQDKEDSNIFLNPNTSQSPIKKIDEKSQKKEGYRFLSDCCFVTAQDKDFLYGTLENLLKGTLKTEKFYNSKQNSSKNPHTLIDHIRGILMIIELENGKIIGAYTHNSFSPLTPHSTHENIAFLFDISGMKYFTNQSGMNSINYNASSLSWGLNELTIEFDKPEYLTTHFGNSRSIFWDGKYRREDFVGVDRNMVRINEYEIYRVTSE